ncbi:MAG: hypothetical protein K8R90_08780 [Candidatus Cloacimonetes bacterium]|nr:hypothetical protein [Candidatus Cloacimonadota bacterium]
MNKFIPLLAALLLTACAYSVYMTQYPHLESIRVTTFENRSTQYAVQEELLLALSGEFQRDGRIKVVEMAPDCVIDGIILDYQNSVYDYDENDVVTRYKVKMLFSVTLTDLVRNEEMWHSESLLLEQVWQSDQSVESSLPQSEEEARAEIYDDLYEQIMKNTFESW